MIDEKLLVDWLNSLVSPLLGGQSPFAAGPRKPEFGVGDHTGIVTPTLGTGLLREGLWDMKAFQIEYTGRERDRDLIRTVVKTYDDALVDLDTPGTYWGVWVTSLTRPGSAPSLLREDEHDRMTYVSTYFAEVAR